MLLVLVACGGKTEEPPAPPPIGIATKAECERAVAHIQELDRTKSAAPEELAKSPVLKEVVTEALKRRLAMLLAHCIDDKWPQSNTNCLVNATDFEASELCTQHLDGYLSQAQIKKLNADHDAIETWVGETVRQRVATELASLEKLRDELCACKTPACRKAVDAKLAKRPADLLVDRESESIQAAITLCRS